jgi:hypothetical protein
LKKIYYYEITKLIGMVNTLLVEYCCNPASLVLEDCKIHLERQSIPPKSQVCGAQPTSGHQNSDVYS